MKIQNPTMKKKKIVETEQLAVNTIFFSLVYHVCVVANVSIFRQFFFCSFSFSFQIKEIGFNSNCLAIQMWRIIISTSYQKKKHIKICICEQHPSISHWYQLSCVFYSRLHDCRFVVFVQTKNWFFCISFAH